MGNSTKAACVSPSPRLVPTKATENETNRNQATTISHFQKGIGIFLSSAQSFNAITARQAKRPSANQKNPLLKKLILNSG